MKNKITKPNPLLQPIVDQCLTGRFGKPCNRIENNICLTYGIPKAQWTKGDCSLSINFDDVCPYCECVMPDNVVNGDKCNNCESTLYPIKEGKK